MGWRQHARLALAHRPGVGPRPRWQRLRYAPANDVDGIDGRSPTGHVMGNGPLRRVGVVGRSRGRALTGSPTSEPRCARQPRCGARCARPSFQASPAPPTTVDPRHKGTLAALALAALGPGWRVPVDGGLSPCVGRLRCRRPPPAESGLRRKTQERCGESIMKCRRCDVCHQRIYRHQRVVEVGWETQFDLSENVLTVHAGHCEERALELAMSELLKRAGGQG